MQNGMFTPNSDRKSGHGISKPKILSGSVAIVLAASFGERQGAVSAVLARNSKGGAVGVLSNEPRGGANPLVQWRRLNYDLSLVRREVIALMP